MSISMCLDLTCITGLEDHGLALKLSYHKAQFLGIGTLSSPSSDLRHTNSAARKAKVLHIDSALDMDTTFCFLEAQEIKVSPKNTH